MIDTFPGSSLRLIVERGTLGCGADLRPDKWTHIAATVDADGTLALYVNGVLAASQKHAVPAELTALRERTGRFRKLIKGLNAAGLSDSYEAAHARLVLTYYAATHQRLRLLAEGRLKPLPGDSQYAADKSYFQTTARLCEGLENVLNSYAKSADPHKQRVYAVWSASP
jgi:hypothetical protein